MQNFLAIRSAEFEKMTLEVAIFCNFPDISELILSLPPYVTVLLHSLFKNYGKGWVRNIQSVTKLLKCNAFVQVIYKKLKFLIFFSSIKYTYKIFNNSGNIYHQMTREHAEKVTKIDKLRCFLSLIRHPSAQILT